MTNPKRLALGTAALALTLAGCGATGNTTDKDVSSAAADGSTPEEKKPTGAIVDSGFGQKAEYAHAVALVHNDSDHGGQTVTVNFNLKDAAGQTIASGSQVAQFNWGGQQVPVSTQIEVPNGQKAASLETSLLVEDEDTFEEQSPNGWGTFDGTIFKDWGDWSAKFLVKNPTEEPMKSPSLQVICYAGDKIIGGGFTYPDLIPPKGESMIDLGGITVSGRPDKCTGYLTPWM